jgi:hypothetical protein
MTGEARYFWSEAEEEALEPHVRALARGRYRSASEAARAYLSEVSGLSGPVRPYEGVKTHIFCLAKTKGFSWVGKYWSKPELAVFARYLRALEEGRYNLVTEAARDCEQELAQLRREHPDEPWASTQRPPGAVCLKLGELARATGRRSRGRRLSREEIRVVQRFVPAVVRGDYPTLRKAAADIRAEFEQRRRADPKHFGPRALHSILAELRPRVQKKGWTVTGSRLSRDERRLLDRYARRLFKQKRPALHESARKCHAEMEALWQRNAALGHKTHATVYTYLGRRLRELGKPVTNPRWTPAAERVLASYARALVEGRYDSAIAATRACMAESPALFRGRHLIPVSHRMDVLASNLHVPRHRARFTPAESSIIDAHARAAAEGRYPSTLASARACFWALQRHYARLRRGSPGSFQSLAGRKYSSIAMRVLNRARYFGRRGPPLRCWSQVEEDTARKWLRLHRRRHAAYWTLTDAAQSLREELERHGYSRTLGACWQKLSCLLHGRPHRTPLAVPPTSVGNSADSK